MRISVVLVCGTDLPDALHPLTAAMTTMQNKITSLHLYFNAVNTPNFTAKANPTGKQFTPAHPMFSCLSIYKIAQAPLLLLFTVGLNMNLMIWILDLLIFLMCFLHLVCSFLFLFCCCCNSVAFLCSARYIVANLITSEG